MKNYNVCVYLLVVILQVISGDTINQTNCTKIYWGLPSFRDFDWSTSGKFLIGNASSSYVNVTYNGQFFYEGEWSNKKPNGHGKCLPAECNFNIDGSYYGGFRNGLRDGEGYSFEGSGFSYSGNYSKDLREGFGVYRKCFGYIPYACIIYKGNWHLDKKHGYGNLTYANGDFFVGTFKEDQQDGQGVYTAANGTIYTGSWQAGRKNGQFTITWPWGDEYIGTIKQDELNGPGIYSWFNGATFNGTFQNGRTKDGILSYNDGTIDKDYTAYSAWQIGIKPVEHTYPRYGTVYEGVPRNNDSPWTIIGPVLGFVLLSMISIVASIIIGKVNKKKNGDRELLIRNTNTGIGL